jgi:hypothetical protein
VLPEGSGFSPMCVLWGGGRGLGQQIYKEGGLLLVPSACTPASRHTLQA